MTAALTSPVAVGRRPGPPGGGPAPARTAGGGPGVATPTGRALPGWPVALPLVLAPLWWVVGASLLVWIATAAVGAVLLATRRDVVAPRVGVLLWAAYVVWCLLSVVQVHDGSRLVGFALRWLMIISAGISLVYVVNTSREQLPLVRVLRWLAVYWCLVVVGGFLGLLAPRVRTETLLHAALPASLASNDFTDVLFSLNTAEASNTASGVYYRPSAPFPYTNAWGSVFALLVPCMLALLCLERRPRVRLVLCASILLGLVPAFFTLNRMMFLSLGVGLVYAGLRFAARGRVRALLAVVSSFVVVGLLSLVIPVVQLISDRVGGSETNQARAGLYQEAILRVAQSPWIGFGTPLPSERAYQTSVGTQGQVWAVLFSHGYPGVALFVGFFLWAWWATRACPSTAEVWLHVVTLVALVQIWVYGFENQNMALFVVVVALALRERRRAPGGVRS